MSQYVTDTMAIVLYLEKRRMPQPVKQLFQSADVGLCTLFIPAIVVAEIGYLSEKGRISLSLADLNQHMNVYAAYQFQPLTLAIIEASYEMTDIPELHDRLIAGTARALTLPLLTNDPIIRASADLQCDPRRRFVAGDIRLIICLLLTSYVLSLRDKQRRVHLFFLPTLHCYVPTGQGVKRVLATTDVALLCPYGTRAFWGGIVLPTLRCYVP